MGMIWDLQRVKDHFHSEILITFVKWNQLSLSVIQEEIKIHILTHKRRHLFPEITSWSLTIISSLCPDEIC